MISYSGDLLDFIKRLPRLKKQLLKKFRKRKYAEKLPHALDNTRLEKPGAKPAISC